MQVAVGTDLLALRERNAALGELVDDAIEVVDREADMIEPVDFARRTLADRVREDLEELVVRDA